MMNFKIMLSTRAKIMNDLVRTRLTYSCQALTLKKRQAGQVIAVYVSMLHKMVKGGYMQKPGAFSYEHCIKYARIWVFTDPYSPV